MRVGIYRRRRGMWLLLIFASLGVSLLFAAFVFRAAPIFKLRAADAAAQAVRRVIAQTAGKTLTDESAPLVDKTAGQGGEITSLSINSARLNKLKADFTKELTDALAKSTKTKIYISFGSLLNCETLQGAGVRIPVSITYGSVCDVDIEDEFVSAGINQTKHLVNLKVKVTVAVISAFMCDTRDIETTLPLCENIIIGGVPKYYSDRLSVAAGGN